MCIHNQSVSTSSKAAWVWDCQGPYHYFPARRDLLSLDYGAIKVASGKIDPTTLTIAHRIGQNYCLRHRIGCRNPALSSAKPRLGRPLQLLDIPLTQHPT